MKHNVTIPLTTESGHFVGRFVVEVQNYTDRERAIRAAKLIVMINCPTLVIKGKISCNKITT